MAELETCSRGYCNTSFHLIHCVLCRLVKKETQLASALLRI